MNKEKYLNDYDKNGKVILAKDTLLEIIKRTGIKTRELGIHWNILSISSLKPLSSLEIDTLKNAIMRRSDLFCISDKLVKGSNYFTEYEGAGFRVCKKSNVL